MRSHDSVSAVLQAWDWHQSTSCLPPCNDFTYDLVRVEKLETTREMSSSTIPGLASVTLCSMIIEIRASDSVIYQEYPIYPISLLLSDIGGIAGLVMGINLVHIISTSSCLWDLTTTTVALLSENYL